MFEDYERKKQKQITSMKSLMDYAMGIIIILIGLSFFFRDKLGIELNERVPVNVIAGLFIAYGAWRIYRGYRKNYFK